MSTLFLIGNGFDINCGMETSYIDVYKKYVKEASSSEVIKKFKESIYDSFETWGDFEIAMGEYAQNLKSEVEFLECIRDFARYMESHLIKENERVKQLLKDNDVLNEIINEMIHSIGKFYNNISHNIDMIMKERNAGFFAKIKVISFNYTDVFDTLYKESLMRYGINGSVIHIHGILQDGPVFGVDNTSQIKACYELTKKGKRGFVKPIFNSEYDEHRVTQATKAIKNASTICVYGMSLGESDLSWRKELIEWLKADKVHHLFVYKYSFSNVKCYTVAEKLDIEDDAKEQLLMEWGISIEKDLLSQIHIPCGKNIFNVAAIIKEELYKREARKELETKKKTEKGEKYIEKNMHKIVLT